MGILKKIWKYILAFLAMIGIVFIVKNKSDKSNTTLDNELNALQPEKEEIKTKATAITKKKAKAKSELDSIKNEVSNIDKKMKAIKTEINTTKENAAYLKSKRKKKTD